MMVFLGTGDTVHSILLPSLTHFAIPRPKGTGAAVSNHTLYDLTGSGVVWSATIPSA